MIAGRRRDWRSFPDVSAPLSLSGGPPRRASLDPRHAGTEKKRKSRASRFCTLFPLALFLSLYTLFANLDPSFSFIIQSSSVPRYLIAFLPSFPPRSSQYCSFLVRSSSKEAWAFLSFPAPSWRPNTHTHSSTKRDRRGSQNIVTVLLSNAGSPRHPISFYKRLPGRSVNSLRFTKNR